MDRARNKYYLIIDLTQETFIKKELKQDIIDNYPSGIALATYLLRLIMPAGTDPLAFGSTVVFAQGIFAGRPYPGATRVGIAAKSPLTGLWAGGTRGGKFAWALSLTEWTAVVIRGRARESSYLLLDEGRVFFRRTKKMEGCSGPECRKEMTKKWGPHSATLCIGPAGESQVKFAILDDESFETPIRGGLGAIFGSKNLKALVVRPYLSIRDEKPGEFLEAVFPLIKILQNPKPSFSIDIGTYDVLKKLNHENALPARNFGTAQFSEGWMHALESLEVRKRSCPGCPLACLEVFIPKIDAQMSEDIIKIPLNPETIWALGPLLKLSDLGQTLAAHIACIQYGIDPISFGIVAAWLAECREKKLQLCIGGDIVPEFGNGSGLPELAAKITKDQRIRNFLGCGVFEAARRTGSESREFAMHFCGLELSFIDPRRGFWPLSFLGPNIEIPCNDKSLIFGLLDETDSVLNLIQAENRWALLESIGICKWVGLVQDTLYENIDLLYRLISGKDKSKKWIDGLGERCMNLIRAFNWQEGWRPEKVKLPKIFFKQDLVTPQQVYPALEADKWLESMTQYFSHWASI